MNRLFAWCIFLTVAFIVSVICFGVNHTLTRSVWSCLRHRNSGLQSWELNTTDNYEIVPGMYTGAMVKEYNFTISEITTYIDGYPRKVLAINGKYPGPLIEAYEGDIIQVKVTNMISDSRTLLHFHGMHMSKTNYFDGSPGLTQCGVGSYNSFLYKFEASPAGTYWYHAHWGTQVVDGLLGPLVVHERYRSADSKGKTDHVIMLTDMYDTDAGDLMRIFQEPWIGGNIEPIPAISLAQGSQHPTVQIAPNEPVRLRIINGASYTTFRLELGSGAMHVVEADGAPTQPTMVTSLLIYPAQRYSVMVTLGESDRMFATPQINMYEISEDFAQFSTLSLNQTSAELHIDLKVGETHLPPLTPENNKALQLEEDDLVEPYFVPLIDDVLPAATTVKYVDLSMTRSNEGSIRGAINDQVSAFSDSESVLYHVFESLLSSEQKLHSNHYQQKGHMHHHNGKDNGPQREPYQNPLGKSLYNTIHDEAIDLVVRNFDDGPHPIHLHGHKVWILERGTLAGSSKNTTWSTNVPLKRDVVWVPKSEFVRIRVLLDNPGLWLLHCHIPWHSRTGMSAIIVTQMNRIKQKLPPKDWFDACSKDPSVYSSLQALYSNSSTEQNAHNEGENM